MLALWSVLWRQAEKLHGPILLALRNTQPEAGTASGAIVGTGSTEQAGQVGIGYGNVSVPVPEFGGWKKYQEVLDLNTPHWSAPKLQPKQPEPVLAPVLKLVGSGSTSQTQVSIGTGELIDVELELITVLIASGAFE